MNNIKLSILITSASESNTINKAIGAILNDCLTFLNVNEFELILVIPDDLTINTAKEYINNNYSNSINYKIIKDEYKGKPNALNIGINSSKGKYILLTDGDVYIEKESIKELLNSIENDNKIGGITGRPKSIDSKDKYWGYIGNLLADAAHYKREKTMNLKGEFFVLSGYLSIIINTKINIPIDCVVDDAYISYHLFNKGYKLKYNDKAVVRVKYANNFRDWINQKLRSVGGYMQLWEYNIVNNKTKVRSLFKELEFIIFPIKYSNNIKEFIWSISLYFLRSYLWLKIFWYRNIQKRKFNNKTWVRIESTK